MTNGQELSESLPEIKTIPWQGKALKYKFPNSPLIVEEVIEPWDLFLESKYLGNDLGDELHVLAVQSRIERIFSIRDGSRRPLVDVLTMPENARSLSAYWSMIRVFRTSYPMTIDGEKLIVLEVLRNNVRASRNLQELAKKFFVAMHGQFHNEWPHYVALATKDERKRWHKMCRGKTRPVLLVGTQPAYQHLIDCHAATPEEAIALLRVSFFDRMYLNVDDKWTDEVMNHLQKVAIDRPHQFLFYGDKKKVEESCIRVRKF